MPERPYFSVYDAQTCCLSVEGAIDELNVYAFGGDLDAAALSSLGGVACSGRLVVELSEVDHFPSVAVGALVAMMKQHRLVGRAVIEVVAEVGTVAQRVLELCGIPHRTR